MSHAHCCGFIVCHYPGKALRNNITTLGPRVLPLSEIVVYAGNFIARKLLRLKGVAPYVPDFQEAAQHICIHTGAFLPRSVRACARTETCLATPGASLD